MKFITFEISLESGGPDVGKSKLTKIESNTIYC